MILGDDVRGQRFFDSELKFSSFYEKEQGSVVICKRKRGGKMPTKAEEVE